MNHVSWYLLEAHELYRRLTDRYEPMPTTDGGSDFTLVTLDHYDKPTCIRHGAMNKVSPSPPGFWRCLHISGCRAGAQEIRS